MSDRGESSSGAGGRASKKEKTLTEESTLRGTDSESQSDGSFAPASCSSPKSEDTGRECSRRSAAKASVARTSLPDGLHARAVHSATCLGEACVNLLCD